MGNPAFDQAESPSYTVTREVAAREGVSPTALDTPLYEVIDPEALDALVGATPSQHPQEPLHIEFTYAGYEVCVSSEGTVSVSPTA